MFFLCGSHGLVKMKDGVFAYITRRFDRIVKRKIYVEDFCQLSLKMTEEKYKGSAELIGKIVKKHSINFGEDLIKLVELFLFCFLTGNSDMHLKNFSLMRDPKGLIRFSPFYDLLSTRLLLSVKKDPDDFALPLNGKKSGLKRSDFKKFSQNFGISDIIFDKSLQRMEASMHDFHETIDESFLSKQKKENFHDLIDLRFKRLL